MARRPAYSIRLIHACCVAKGALSIDMQLVALLTLQLLHQRGQPFLK